MSILESWDFEVFGHGRRTALSSRIRISDNPEEELACRHPFVAGSSEKFARSSPYSSLPSSPVDEESRVDFVADNQTVREEQEIIHRAPYTSREFVKLNPLASSCMSTLTVL